MKKIAAALAIATLAGSLAACGSSTSNDAGVNAVVENETVPNDELVIDADGAIANDAAVLDNGTVAETVLTPTDNAL